MTIPVHTRASRLTAYRQLLAWLFDGGPDRLLPPSPAPLHNRTPEERRHAVVEAGVVRELGDEAPAAPAPRGVRHER